MIEAPDPIHRRTNGVGTMELKIYTRSFGQTIEKRKERKEYKVNFKSLPPIEGTPAVVGTTRGLTINMGNFEYARVDVHLDIPCNPASVDEAYELVEKWVDSKVMKQVKEVRKASNGQ